MPHVLFCIPTVLKRALSQEQNIRQVNGKENKGSGKSKILQGIPGYGQFLKGNRDQTPPWWDRNM